MCTGKRTDATLRLEYPKEYPKEDSENIQPNIPRNTSVRMEANNEQEGICVAIRIRPLNEVEVASGQSVAFQCIPQYNQIGQVRIRTIAIMILIITMVPSSSYGYNQGWALL